MLNIEQLKNKFIELVDIDIDDIVDVIEIDGNAMIYLKDKTKFAFLVEEEKVIPIEKAPSKKVEMVIDNELEREQEYTDEAYEEFEEDLLNEEIPDEYFEDLEDSEWDAIEEAVEKEENKEKVREAKKAAREKRLKAERERRLAEKSQSVDPTYNQETGHTYAQDVNDERLAEINKRLAEERRIEAQRQFDEALQAEKLRIEAEKAAYADDLEKYRYKVGFADENKNQNTAPDFTQTVEPQKESEAEYESAGISKTPKKEKVEVAPVTEETYKQIEDVHQSETYGEQRQAHSYQTVNATFDGTHYVADNGYKFKQEEVLITPSGSIIDNRDNLYELDDKGNVLINATPVREPVAENFHVINATLKDDYYVTDNGDKYSRDEVIVTHTGAIVDNRDNYYALNNNGHIVYNPVVFESKPVETYKPLEVTLKDDYYVSNDGQKYKADEVLVTPTGVIIENKNNHYKLDDEGFVVYAAPVITAPVEQVAYGYKTIEVLANNGDHFIADNGLKYKQEDVLVTHDGSIVDNRDNLYKLNHEGNVVVNTDIVREPIAQSYNVINATLEDNHYVADNGYRYKPEEVIVTKSGAIIDNRDNLYKLDNVGNVVINDIQNHVSDTPIREPIAQSYHVINATLENDHYVAENGYRYRQDEVLITKTGAIIDNRDNTYKLDNSGDVVINTNPTKEPVAQSYQTINATLKDDYYVSESGHKYRQEEVLVTPSGAIIDNRDNLYKLDNSGSVVVNTTREPIAQSYQTVKATFDGNNYVSDDGYKYKPSEVLVTKNGSIVDNRDNIYKLDNSGNVVVNITREQVAQGYNVINVASKTDDYYIADNGQRYKPTEVLVTRSGELIDNRDNLYKLDNTGSVVVNTDVFKERQAQGYSVVNATLKDDHYVTAEGYKYRQDEVLVTKSGQIIDNRDNIYKLDSTGAVIINANPVRETISHDYTTVKATFDGTHYVADNGYKYRPEEVLVTKTGTIIDNRDNGYKLDNSGNVVINHSPIKDVIASDYQTVKATFDGTHYVSDSGYKYRPEEVLITKTGAIVDNRDNAYKFDNHGNIVINTTREQTAHSYSVLEANYKDGVYTTNDGRKFQQSEVLVTPTGAIINNRDNLYKLNNNGEVVLNTGREPIAQSYQTINATLKDNHYVTADGYKYKPEEVLVTKTGAIIDNRDNAYKLDSVGNVVINTAYTEKVATGYAVVDATFKDGSYITADGRKFAQSEVLVTSTGSIINNKDNLYKLDNSGNVVLNTAREPIAQSYQTVKATFDGTHYVAESGYKYRPEEVLVTKAGTIIDNRDNVYKLDGLGNVIVNTTPIKETVAHSYNVVDATFKDGAYITTDGRRFEKADVLVTSTGAIINNKDNLYKLDNSGNVVLNTVREPIAQSYQTVKATFDGTHYVADNGYKYNPSEVLVTKTGIVIDNRDNIYKLDNFGNVVVNTTPIKETVAHSYNVVNATFKDGAYITTDGRKFTQSEVLVTPSGTIINNKDNLYRLDNSGNVVLNTHTVREPIAQGYNAVKATFDGTHYVSESGYKYRPEEVLITKTGVIVDNRDNLYKLDNAGNIIVNRSYIKEQAAQSYNVLSATFDGKQYVTTDGKRYNADEVLVTKTGAIIDNKDNLYKLDRMGNVVINKGDFGKTVYNPLSATFTGTHYITNDGRVYDKADVITLANGSIIENTTGRFRVDSQGNIVENRANNIPFVIPQRASSTSDMNAHYTIAGVPFLIDAKAKQTNMSLNETAHVVMRDLKIESTTLRGEILSARQELAKLKATGGDVEKIKALELLIKGKNDRIVEIAGHQMRVEDYIRFGSRKEFALTKESLEKAGYSKEHLRDLRNMAKAGNKTDISNVNKTRGGKGTTNIQEIHNNRMQALMSKFGGKFATGTGRAFKRMMRDSDELREEVEIYDETSLGARVVYGHASSALLKAELAKLGLDKATMMLQLEKIGVIAGVGNVSKMSLEDLQKAFTTLNLSSNAKKDLLEAIDLKKKLLMSNKELARMFLGDAGEYLGYSTKRLQKMLEVTTDLKVKKQIETALKYKKLSKLNSASMGKWRATASFITDAFRKFAKNDENISAILDLSDNTMGAYRVSKTAVNITKSLVKKNAEKKAAQEVGKKLVKTTMDVGKKQAAGKAAHAANQQLIRTMATKEGGKAVATGVGGKVANTKLGQTLASGMAKIKGVFGIGGAAGSAGAGGAAGTAAGAGGTIAGGSVAVVAAIVILILLVVGFGLLLCSSLYTMIFGDETTDPNKTGMSVVEMIDYLEDKNTNLLVELENHEKGTPSKKDKQGNTLSEYTKIHYTFYDENGNICITTNNTKELISMAAVYFEQDLSDKNAIKKYLDEMWNKTHIITYTESALYGCDGNVCLHEDGTFASDAKGFNAGERKFQCTEDYYSILYNNCFMIPTENTRRIEIDKLSERLANSYLTASQFNGISPILVKTSLKGYGCKELVNTVYCTNINSITNTEILVRLVEATGKSYSTLKSDQACVVGGKKHSNSYNKAASGCGDYKLYYQTNEMSTAYDLGSDLTFTWNSSKKAYINKMGLSFKGFSKYVLSSGQEPNLTEITLTYNGSTGSGYNKTYNYSYRTYTYVCQEVNKSCPGHAIAYHYCDGQHKEKVCYGHVDLTINICVKSFDDTFSIYTDDSRADFTWDEDNIEWAKSLYGQDWEDLYGVYVSGSLFADDMVAAIMPTHPNSLPIPLYDQTDYPNSPYGAYGTVASHGCGITCVAMLNAYYIDEDVSPAYLARIFGNYNTEHGSYWSLFGDSAEVLGIPFEKQTSSWSEVVQALQDGKPVVSIQNSNGIFTSGGHFILLTGITPEGKILVNDPNGANYYKNATLIDGFANGFAQSHIQVGSSGAYWIYGVKP